MARCFLRRSLVALSLCVATAVVLAAACSVAGKKPGVAATLKAGGSGGAVSAIAAVRELSDPRYEGRQAGSPGALKARAYIKSLFDKIGLQVTTMEFSERVPVYVRDPGFSLSLPGEAERTFEFRKDYREVANGAWIEERAEGPLAIVDSPWANYPKGSIVVVSGQDYDNSNDVKFLENGAVGLLVIVDAASIERRSSYPGQAPQQKAMARRGLVKMAISAGIMPYIERASLAGAVATLKNPLAFENRECANILASWNGDGGSFAPGIMFIAHYDHVGGEIGGGYFAGALDNASGVGLLLSIAENFARDGIPADAAFLLTDAEEINLSGSSAFARSPPFKLSGIDAINLDMVGGAGDTRLSIYSNGDGPSLELGERLAKALGAAGIESEREHPVPNVDSGPLGYAGASAVTIYEYDAAVLHTQRDISAGVSEKELAALEAALYDFALDPRKSR